MTNNYSILQNNILLQYTTEEGAAAFLWACDRRCADRYQYAAEKFGQEVELLTNMLGPMIKKSVDIHNFPAGAKDVKSDVLDFILDRHSHLRYDGKSKWRKK